MATADFAISDFMSKLDGLGSYAKSNRFSVQVVPPTGLSSNSRTIQPATIEFLAKTVSLPARAFGTTTYRNAGKHSLEVPYETTYEAVSVTFLGTNDWTPRKFWIDWFEHIQTTDLGSTSGRRAVGSYNMKYYKDYKGTVTISTYNEEALVAESPSHKITLHDVWPKTISAIELGWESAGLIDFTVDLVYSRWTNDN